MVRTKIALWLLFGPCFVPGDADVMVDVWTDWISVQIG